MTHRKRGGQRKEDNFDANEIVFLYESGMSMQKIAVKFNTNYSRIRSRLLEAGVIPRQPISQNDVDWDSVINQYQNGKSINKIAKEIGCSSTFIRDGLAQRNVKIRDWRTQIALDCKNGVDGHAYVNEKFFDEWSHEMAYVLGWIYTDGNIPQEKNAFRITSTDVEHLKNIAQLFAKDVTISIRKWDRKKHPKNRVAGTLSIGRVSMVNRLLELGITPAKTKNIRFPDVPDEFLGDFVRGVFEGDGCLTLKLAKKKYLMPKINISSGSREFLVVMGERIMRKYKIQYCLYNQGNTWGLEYYSFEAIKTFFDLMYRDTPPNMILKRKYDIFIEYFESKGVAV